jgi:hypothetical protein
MSEYITFVEQASGEMGTPDILIHLPNHGHVPVDSKFTASAFLEAMTATDENSRKELLEQHAKDLRRTVNELSKRNYWKEFDQASPELVIMFVPIESCLMAAFQFDPDILEFALEKKVILASPVTLFGYMKSIHYGWQQFKIRQNAKLIVKEAKALHDKTEIWIRHFRETGKKVMGVVESYDKCVGSLQRTFFPACRKLEGLSGIAEELAEPDPLAIAVRLPTVRAESVLEESNNGGLFSHSDDSDYLAGEEQAMPSTFSSESNVGKINVVVVWTLAEATPNLTTVLEDIKLWRSLFDAGVTVFRHEINQKGADGQLILDAKGYRHYVEAAGLPALLIVEQRTGNVKHHCRLPENSKEIMSLLNPFFRNIGAGV